MVKIVSTVSCFNSSVEFTRCISRSRTKIFYQEVFRLPAVTVVGEYQVDMFNYRAHVEQLTDAL